MGYLVRTHCGGGGQVLTTAVGASVQLKWFGDIKMDELFTLFQKNVIHCGPSINIHGKNRKRYVPVGF